MLYSIFLYKHINLNINLNINKNKIMENLNKDILIYIFSQLKVQDVMNISEVNKFFKNIVNSDKFWMTKISIDFEVFNKNKNGKFFQETWLDYYIRLYRLNTKLIVHIPGIFDRKFNNVKDVVYNFNSLLILTYNGTAFLYHYLTFLIRPINFNNIQKISGSDYYYNLLSNEGDLYKITDINSYHPEKELVKTEKTEIKKLVNNSHKTAFIDHENKLIFTKLNTENYKLNDFSFFNKTQIKNIALSDSHGGIIDIHNNLYMFGDNSKGQLGVKNIITCGKILNLNLKVDKVSCGKYHTAVLIDNKVYTFGINVHGELGNGKTGELRTWRHQLVNFEDSKKIKDITTGRNSTYFIDILGNLYITGFLCYDRFGRKIFYSTPFLLKKYNNVIQINSGSNLGFFLRTRNS